MTSPDLRQYRHCHEKPPPDVLVALVSAPRATLDAGTNLEPALAEWSALATNSLDAIGACTFTNPLNPALPHQFYWLRVP